MNSTYINTINQNNKFIIRIPKDKPYLLIFGIGVAFIALRSIVPFLYGMQVIFVFYMGIKAIKNRNLFFTHKYVIISMLYLFWCCLTILWCSSVSSGISTLISIGQMVLLCSLIAFYIRKEESIDKILFGFAIASIIMLIFLFIKTDQSEWVYALTGSFSVSTDQGRIGYSIGYHPNGMGNLCAMLAFIWLYFYDKTKKKLYILFILLLSIILLFTKSRASIIMMAMEFFGYILLNKKKRLRILKMIPIVLLLSIISYWAIFNIPILYEIIGFRMAGLVGLVNSSYSVDASAYTRMNMITYGLDIFMKYPISGVGIGNYGYYAYNYYGLFAQTYAHCNYVELMADIGLIGLILYYILPIYSCIILWLCLKRTNGNRRKLCAFLFVTIAVRLIMDFVKITYDDELAQMLNMICYCGAKILYNNKSL